MSTELKIAIKHNIPTLLVGPTGSGKTTMIRELAKAKKKKLVRQTFTADTTVDEVTGKYELKGGDTVKVYGELVRCMQEGLWYVADELNMASGDILSALHPLLDDDRFLVLTTLNGEVITPHKDFRFFATMNPSDGVEGASYAGTKALNSAFMSRFGMVIYTNYLGREDEVKLIVDKVGVTTTVAGGMVDIANSLRLKQSVGELTFTCSTRDLLAWASLVKGGMDETDAFAAAVSNKAGAEREMVVKLASQENEKIAKILERANHAYDVDTVEKLEAKIAELSKLKGDVDTIKAQVKGEILKEFDERKKGLDERSATLDDREVKLNDKLVEAYNNGRKDSEDKIKELLRG